MRARLGEALLIQRLDERHPGITPGRAAALYEAATVCLERHHTPPTVFRVDDEGDVVERQLEWERLGRRVKLANANETDATCDGAYAVSLAAVELERGLVAIGRAWTGSGADYYLSRAEDANVADLEKAVRLEVSGVDKGAVSVLSQRLKEKKRQAADGASDSPALAAVVGFRERLVLLGNAL